jgi:hypothetical protein
VKNFPATKLACISCLSAGAAIHGWLLVPASPLPGLHLPGAQSSRLAVFGGRGMSFNICRGTLGSLAMFTAIRNASSRVRSYALERRPGSFS